MRTCAQSALQPVGVDAAGQSSAGRLDGGCAWLKDSSLISSTPRRIKIVGKRVNIHK